MYARDAEWARWQESKDERPLPSSNFVQKGLSAPEESCKRHCKRTTQHRRARGITSWDVSSGNSEPKHTLSYWTTHTSMRILELENRCTGNRTVRFESHPLRQLWPQAIDIANFCLGSAMQSASLSTMQRSNRTISRPIFEPFATFGRDCYLTGPASR
jgi:hypothetical protein